MRKQLNLFKAKSLNIKRDFKECFARLVDDSGLSRAEFLDRMNVVADQYGIRLMRGNGTHLTMATFEKWLNVNQLKYAPPIDAIEVIMEVSGSHEILQVFAEPFGLMVLGEKGVKKYLWAEAKFEEKEARKKIRKLEADL